jgi:hypothetical protein
VTDYSSEDEVEDEQQPCPCGFNNCNCAIASSDDGMRLCENCHSIYCDGCSSSSEEEEEEEDGEVPIDRVCSTCHVPYLNGVCNCPGVLPCPYCRLYPVIDGHCADRCTGSSDDDDDETVGSNQNRSLNTDSPRSPESIQMLYNTTQRQGTPDSPASPDPEPFVRQASNSIRNIAEMMGWIEPSNTSAVRTRLRPTPPPTYDEAVADGADIFNTAGPTCFDAPIEWAEGELEAILALPSSDLSANSVAPVPNVAAAPAPVAATAPAPVVAAAPVPVAAAAPVPVAAAAPAPVVAAAPVAVVAVTPVPAAAALPTAVVPALPAAGEELQTRPLPDYLGDLTFFDADTLLSNRPHTTEEQFREVIRAMNPAPTVWQLQHLQDRMFLNREFRGADPVAAAAATLVQLGRRPMLTVLPMTVTASATAAVQNENDDIG